MNHPTIDTRRLVLRAFSPDDADAVQELAGDARVADTTLNIPHPYPPGAAEKWIALHAYHYEAGSGVTFAMVLRESGALCGSISLTITPAHSRAELGYWLTVPMWNKGFTTEAAIAVLEYAFGSLKLNRIHAHHFTRNPASGRVMQKIGMKFEGVQRGHVRKGTRYEDVACYGILRDDWLAAGASGKP